MNPKKLAQAIAQERIKILFGEAEKAFDSGNKKRANQYTGLALKIAQKYRVRMPKQLKDSYCKKCRCYLKLGANAKKRINKKYYTLTCGECGKSTKKAY